MSRNLINPYKNFPVYVPQRPDLSLCVMTHWPGIEWSYHQRRMEVIGMAIQSMLNGLPDGINYELIVWDNGSHIHLRDELRKTFKIDVLAESRQNLGCRWGWWNMTKIARSPLVYITDDDVFHYPNWFDAHNEILVTYPNVGSVSGSPIRQLFRFPNESTKKWAIEDPDCEVEAGDLIPHDWLEDYDLSTGQKEGNSVSIKKEQDILLTYHGVKAWAHGHHMQFLGYAENFLDPMERVALTAKNVLDDSKPFEKLIDSAGFLRLTTYDRTARHIGNELDFSIWEAWETSYGRKED